MASVVTFVSRIGSIAVPPATSSGGRKIRDGQSRCSRPRGPWCSNESKPFGDEGIDERAGEGFATDHQCVADNGAASQVQHEGAVGLCKTLHAADFDLHPSQRQLIDVENEAADARSGDRIGDDFERDGAAGFESAVAGDHVKRVRAEAGWERE